MALMILGFGVLVAVLCWVLNEHWHEVHGDNHY